MARKTNRRLDYFPVDTTIFDEKKIVLFENEFGTKGFKIYMKLLSEIYGSEYGYYLPFAEDDQVLFAKRVGYTCAFVNEVVQGSIRRFLFNKEVFDKFHILTSAGIQRRYYDAVSKCRRVIIIEEKEVALTLVEPFFGCKKINVQESALNVQELPINVQESALNVTRMPVSKSKVNIITTTTGEIDFFEIENFFKNKGLDSEISKFIAFNENLQWQILKKQSLQSVLEQWHSKILAQKPRNEHQITKNNAKKSISHGSDF